MLVEFLGNKTRRELPEKVALAVIKARVAREVVQPDAQPEQRVKRSYRRRDLQAEDLAQ